MEMRPTTSIITLLTVLSGCTMTPEEMEQATTRLEVGECSTRAAGVYDGCVRDCNTQNSPENAQATCTTNVDTGMVDYLKGISPSLATEIRSDLATEVGQKFNEWTTARTLCANQRTATERVRADCVGDSWGRGFLWQNAYGCEAKRQDAYNECIGTCPGDNGRGTVCSPQSATVPSWAECGTWQNDAAHEGQCTCLSDESGRASDKSFCREFVEAMNDPRYGSDCNDNASDTIANAPYVDRDANRNPTGILWKCVAWTNGVPDFRTEASIQPTVEAPRPDANSCPSNLDEPGHCDEADGRCPVGTDADDCAVTQEEEDAEEEVAEDDDAEEEEEATDEEEEVDPPNGAEEQPVETPDETPAAAEGCACGGDVVSADRHGACDCAGSWRVVHISDWDADVSQVCRNGSWLTFNWAPRDADACCSQEFSGCCQASDPALRCP